MMRPQLTPDGMRVRLPVADRTVPLVDELALAYAENPQDVGRLLAAHAASVLAADFAECSEDTPEWQRAIRAAQANGTRDALTESLPSALRLDEELTPHDAITLAARLTRTAATARMTQNRKTAP